MWSVTRFSLNLVAFVLIVVPLLYVAGTFLAGLFGISV